MSKQQISIYEVGPRDGLQNEPELLSVELKTKLIEKLNEAGLVNIEAGAFVSSRWVPQMATTDQVFNQLKNRQYFSTLSVLTPNIQGFEKALALGLKEVAVFTAASETFNQKNSNASINESFQRFKPIFQKAQQENIRVRGYLSCSFHCPYEGFIHVEQVQKQCQTLIDMGCYQVSLGDTTGKATPPSVEKLLELLLNRLPASMLAGHFHDTYGLALCNVYTAFTMGLKNFDTSVAGLGGCPYALGASGNLATEDLVHLFHSLNIETGVDLNKLCDIAHWISQAIRPHDRFALRSKVGQAVSRKLNTNC